MHNAPENASFGDLPAGRPRHVMAKIDMTGDTRIEWDPAVPAEVEAARRQFEFLTKKQNYKAFRMDGRDEVGEFLDEFDPQAQRITFAPKNVGG